MKNLIKIGTVVLSTALTVLGILYVIDQQQQKKIGGKLVKVDYRFSKEFE